MGLIYRKQGQILRARHWFSKTLHHQAPESTWYRRAEKQLIELQITSSCSDSQKSGLQHAKH
jgi:hypothetical protein